MCKLLVANDAHDLPFLLDSNVMLARESVMAGQAPVSLGEVGTCKW